MSVTYGFGLLQDLSEEEIRRFLVSVPNDGLTELVDGSVNDVRLDGAQLAYELFDDGVGEYHDDARDLLQRSGSFGHDTASYLALAKCILVPSHGEALPERFDDWKVKDVAVVASEVLGTIHDTEAPPAVREDCIKLEPLLRRAEIFGVAVLVHG